MKTSYYTINDQILGERSSGNDRINYAPDALGSVIGTVASGSIQNLYVYRPFGSVLSKVGASSDPAFMWVGALGYRGTGRSWCEQYVRIRNFSTSCSRWTTTDPLWPGQSPFTYGEQNPLTNADPSGLVAITPGKEPPSGGGKDCCCCIENVTMNGFAWRRTRKPTEDWKLILDFDTFVSYKCHAIRDPKVEHQGDISLYWWEKSTHEKLLIPIPNRWTEQFHKSETHSSNKGSTFADWLKHPTCPTTTETVKLPDHPEFTIDSTYASGSTKLCIHVMAESSWPKTGGPHGSRSACNCPVSMKEDSILAEIPLYGNGRYKWPPDFPQHPCSTGYCKLGWKTGMQGPLEG